MVIMLISIDNISNYSCDLCEQVYLEKDIYTHQKSPIPHIPSCLSLNSSFKSSVACIKHCPRMHVQGHRGYWWGGRNGILTHSLYELLLIIIIPYIHVNIPLFSTVAPINLLASCLPYLIHIVFLPTVILDLLNCIFDSSLYEDIQSFLFIGYFCVWLLVLFSSQHPLSLVLEIPLWFSFAESPAQSIRFGWGNTSIPQRWIGSWTQAQLLCVLYSIDCSEWPMADFVTQGSPERFNPRAFYEILGRCFLSAGFIQL